MNIAPEKHLEKNMVLGREEVEGQTMSMDTGELIKTLISKLVESYVQGFAGFYAVSGLFLPVQSETGSIRLQLTRKHDLYLHGSTDKIKLQLQSLTKIPLEAFLAAPERAIPYAARVLEAKDLVESEKFQDHLNSGGRWQSYLDEHSASESHWKVAEPDFVVIQDSETKKVTIEKLNKEKAQCNS